MSAAPDDTTAEPKCRGFHWLIGVPLACGVFSGWRSTATITFTRHGAFLRHWSRFLSPSSSTHALPFGWVRSRLQSGNR